MKEIPLLYECNDRTPGALHDYGTQEEITHDVYLS